MTGRGFGSFLLILDNTMKEMPNVWLDSLESFDAVVKQLEKCLTVLRANASKADFTELDIKRQYSNDIMYTKQFFERAEYLARNGDINGSTTKKKKRKVKTQHTDTGLDRKDTE